MTCQHMMTLGVYLLGALEPAERSAFESHLSYCEICRGELVRLSPLPGLLNQITPEDFADSLPPTGAESVVATQANPITEPVPLPQIPLQPVSRDDEPRSRPRSRPGKDRPPKAPKRYWRVTAAAAAVVVLAVAAVFGWQAIRHETVPSQAEGVLWTAASQDGKIRVEARLIDHRWGTEIRSEIHGLPPGKKCYYLVWDHEGYKEQGGWWSTDHDPNDVIPSVVSIPRSEIDRLELKLDRDTVVLTVWPPA
jgi:anti-sigma factor RsiW